MSKYLLSLLLLLALIFPSVAPYSAAQEAPSSSPRDSRSSPLMFIENVGQWDAGARFQVRGGNSTIWLAEDALWLTVVERSATGAAGLQVDKLAGLDPERANLEPSNLQPNAANIKVSFVGANLHPRIEPFDRLDTAVSYFLGNEPEKWRPDVPVWGGVRYLGLYPGVDLELTSEGGQMVHRLAARPGAELAVVQLRVEGADDVTVDGDALRLTTAAGEFALPLLRADGLQVAGLKVESRGTQVFDIAAPTAPVNSKGQSHIANPQSVADSPADLLYSTFLGGSCSEEGYAIAVDGAGSAYVTGKTCSSDFPTTAGAFDTNSNGSYDAFVAKLNPAGSGLAYSTFLGGGGGDYGRGIAVDGMGSAYVTGDTTSSDLPVTLGAFDASYNGGNYGDAFVVKLNPAGSGLTYATFLGGDHEDSGRAVIVDAVGSAYAIGTTNSSNFPATQGAFNTSLHGDVDTFVVKLDPIGSGLIYATFLGGSGGDYGRGIAVDEADNAYVTGGTRSPDFPTTSSAFDTSFNGSSVYLDAFVVKLNPAGSGLVYATFLGGTADDAAEAIVLDGAGSAYVAGYANSSNFPATSDAFDTVSNSYDAFVVKLDPMGSELIYATFLGGSGGDYGEALAVDGAGRAYVTGYTWSSDFPTTPGTFDAGWNGHDDVFMAKMNRAGSGLAYSTFLGGGSYDEGYAIAIDRAGSAYVTGLTYSSDFLTTSGAFDTSFNGGDNDAFVVKLATTGTGGTYTISGTVSWGDSQPAEGVLISVGDAGSVLTDASGAFRMDRLAPGTYTITPTFTAYVFSPVSRTVTVPNVTDGQNFWGRTVSPFLDFPANYPSAVRSRAFVYGDNGYINSWFDHAYPDYGEPITDPIRRYDGATTYEAYGGHDGLDFDDSSTDQTTLTSVVAAHEGVVTHVYDTCNQSCPGGSCCEYLGNRVEINHKNGYRTVYGHFAHGSLLVEEGDEVSQGQALGTIGTTGSSTGNHIHFEVSAFTGNGWQVVDPFGWSPLGDEDPWVSAGGPDSFYLWNWRFENGITFQADVGTITTDPAGFADSIAISGTSSGGEVMATVTNPPPPGLSDMLRSLGRYFRLKLESLLRTSTMGAAETDISAPDYAPDITITMPFLTTELRHLDPAQLAIQHYDADAQQWYSLQTTVDFVNNTAVATTDLTGDFALNAPLLCSGDAVEPDDEHEKATPLWLNNGPLARLLDISEDTDWTYFSAVEGVQYTLATQNLTGGDTVLRLYDSDGETLVTTDDNRGGGLASLIQWIAPRTETYFVEVISGSSGYTGCSAGYELALTGNPPPQVDHALLTDDLELSWRHDNAAVVQYEVWRSDLPYFDMVVGEGTSKTNVSTGELGALVVFSEGLPANGGYYYRVRGATAGDMTPASDVLGVFSFPLTPGAP